MKKFVRKTISWVLTASMISPLLAYFPISYAAGTEDGELTLDERIDAAVGTFKNNNTKDGVLSQLHYNVATMYNYDALAFNQAMRDIELSALTNGINPNSSVYQAGKWNGFYFHTNSDNLDGKETLFGAELVNYTELDEFVTGKYSDVMVGETVIAGVERVVIPDGEYKIGSNWDDATSENRWIVEASDLTDDDDETGNVLLGGMRENAMILTFTQIGDTGAYTIQNALGQYLYAEAAGYADTVNNVVKFVNAADGTHTTFYIYKQTDGDFVLKAGGDGFNWFLCNRGAYISSRGEAVAASSVLISDANTFQLVKVVDYTVSETGATIQFNNITTPQIVIPDGQYKLYGDQMDAWVSAALAGVADENSAVVLNFARVGNTNDYYVTYNNQYLSIADGTAQFVPGATTVKLYRYPVDLDGDGRADKSGDRIMLAGANADYLTSGTHSVITPMNIEAESGTLAGAAFVENPTASGGWHVGEIGGDANHTVAFTVKSPATGTATIRVYYSTGMDRQLSVTVNNGEPQNVLCENNNYWAVFDDERFVDIEVPVNAGNNTIVFGGADGSFAPNIDRFEFMLGKLEMESGTNNGGQVVGNEDANEANASNGAYMGNIGGAGGATVSFEVDSAASGKAILSVCYGTEQDRNLSVTVNGIIYPAATCAATGGWDAFTGTVSVEVDIVQGTNTIVFGGVNGGFAPNLDYFTIESVDEASAVNSTKSTHTTAASFLLEKVEETAAPTEATVNLYRLYGLSGKYLLSNLAHGDFVKINQDAHNDYNMIVDDEGYAITDLVRTGGATEWTITEVEPGIYTLTKVITKNNPAGGTTSTTYYLAVADNDANTDKAWVMTEADANATANLRYTRFHIYRYTGGNQPAIVLKSGLYTATGEADNQNWFMNVPGGDKNTYPKFVGNGQAIVDGLANNGNAYYLYDLTAESDDVFYYEYASFNQYVGAGNKAFPGIMNDTLVNGVPTLSTGVDLPIFGIAPVDGKQVYENVQMPFIPVKLKGKTGKDYTTYVFDSDLYSAYFEGGAASNTTLRADAQQQSTTRAEIGAWLPFNDSSVTTNGVYCNPNNPEQSYGLNAPTIDGLNYSTNPYKFYQEDGDKQYATDFTQYADYHFGLTLSIPFSMTADGKIEGEDMTFSFRGDDDVWVFVDGQLVLDLGGIHDKIGGSINFATNEWTLDYVDSLQDEYTYYVNTPDGSDPMGDNLNTTQVKGNIFSSKNGVTDIADDTPKIANQTFEQFQATDYHTLTVVYLERGEAASNCRMTYNLLQNDTVSVEKNVAVEDSYLTEDDKAAIEDIEFEFTLLSTHDQISLKPLPDGAIAPLTGIEYTLLQNNVIVPGTYATDTNGKFKLKNGQKAVFTLESGSAIDSGTGIQVVETEMPGFDDAKTVCTFNGVTYGSYAYNLSDHTEKVYSGTTGRNDASYITFDNSQLGLESPVITIDGVNEESDELHFVFTNYYGLSDKVVIDYGLSVGIELDQLDYWKNHPEYILSNLVINGYHNGEQALYGSIANANHVKIEAEDSGEFTQGIVNIGNNPEASGGEHVNDIGKIVNGVEGTATFTYNSPYAGKAILNLYYITWEDRDFEVEVNGGAAQVVAVPGNGNSWTTPSATPASLIVDLKAGENTIVISGNKELDENEFAPNLDYITISMLSPDMIKLEAEDGVINGNAAKVNSDNASGSTHVGDIQGATNTVSFTVNSPIAGDAVIAVRYNQADTRSFNISVGTTGDTQAIQFEKTGAWGEVYKTKTVTVNLAAGENKITFGGVGTAYAPNLDYISIDLPDEEIVYQLTEQMTAVDVINYTVDATDANGNTTTVPGIIYVIPATVMYYEENFKDEGNNNWINYVDGTNYAAWEVTAGSVMDTDHQEAGFVGKAAYIYGSDAAYLNDADKDSNGTSMHVTTDATKPAQFSYTFMGTGTSFFARTNANSGYMQVVISDADGDAFYTYYRDTRYIDTNDAPLDNGMTLYNIPVFSWDAVSDSGLGYGEYTVTVTISKRVEYTNEVTNNTFDIYGYEFWLDGIRVFNPLDESAMYRAMELAADDDMMSRAAANTALAEAQRVSIAQSAYGTDKEYSPDTNTVREKLLADYDYVDGDWKVKAGLTDYAPVLSANFTDSNSAIANVNEFWLRGPKEEVYLSEDQSVTVYLKADGLEDANVHLGIKIPFGESGKVAVNGTTVTANGATDCYYDVTAAAKSTKVGNWYKVTITAGDNAGLVSLTNLKVTMAYGYEILEVN